MNLIYSVIVHSIYNDDGSLTSDTKLFIGFVIFMGIVFLLEYAGDGNKTETESEADAKIIQKKQKYIGNMEKRNFITFELYKGKRAEYIVSDELYIASNEGDRGILKACGSELISFEKYKI